PLRQLPVDPEQLCGPHVEAASLEAGQDVSGEPTLHRIWLDQDECALRGHGARSLLSAPPAPPLRRKRGQLERRGRVDRRRAVWADLPERLEGRLALGARLLQLGR